MHKIPNLWKFELNSSKLQDNNGRKNTTVTLSCVLSDAWFRDPKIKFWGLLFLYVSNLWKITSFSKSTFFERELLLYTQTRHLDNVHNYQRLMDASRLLYLFTTHRRNILGEFTFNRVQRRAECNSGRDIFKLMAFWDLL